MPRKRLKKVVNEVKGSEEGSKFKGLSDAELEAALEGSPAEKEVKEPSIDWTVKELEAYAKENKIDLGDAKKKEDKLEKILSAGKKPKTKEKKEEKVSKEVKKEEKSKIEWVVVEKTAAEIKKEAKDLTIAELKEYAAENKIDLGDATKKSDILDTIISATIEKEEKEEKKKTEPPSKDKPIKEQIEEIIKRHSPKSKIVKISENPKNIRIILEKGIKEDVKSKIRDAVSKIAPKKRISISKKQVAATRMVSETKAKPESKKKEKAEALEGEDYSKKYVSKEALKDLIQIACVKIVGEKYIDREDYLTNVSKFTTYEAYKKTTSKPVVMIGDALPMIQHYIEEFVLVDMARELEKMAKFRLKGKPTKNPPRITAGGIWGSDGNYVKQNTFEYIDWDGKEKYNEYHPLVIPEGKEKKDIKKVAGKNDNTFTPKNIPKDVENIFAKRWGAARITDISAERLSKLLGKKIKDARRVKTDPIKKYAIMPDSSIDKAMKNIGNITLSSGITPKEIEKYKKSSKTKEKEKSIIVLESNPDFLESKRRTSARAMANKVVFDIILELCKDFDKKLIEGKLQKITKKIVREVLDEKGFNTKLLFFKK